MKPWRTNPGEPWGTLETLVNPGETLANPGETLVIVFVGNPKGTLVNLSWATFRREDREEPWETLAKSG